MMNSAEKPQLTIPRVTSSVSYDLFGNPVLDAKRTLSDYFGVAPFSILNTTDKDWINRKQRWNKLINDTGQARKNVLAGGNSEKDVMNNMNGSSILDAVLAELMIKWFTEEGFTTFDPFAGDTVFGFVSGYLKRPFEGIELRQEQVDFNQMQCNRENINCIYICDTSENMDKYIENESKDFIFSCPPYADLEVYSDLKEDLSTMSHEDFFKVYEKVLKNTYNKLKNDRFAVIVTSEVRNKKGEYIRLVPNTINIMVEAGYIYYNEIILMNSVGTLPMRTGRHMNAGRKIGRRHQNVLVFYKGNPNNIKNNFSELIPKNEYYESTNLE
jgi:DNA modification methylase